MRRGQRVRSTTSHQPARLTLATGRRPRSARPRFAAVDDMPPGRPVRVHSKDGVFLHAEVFGPEDGYPIVLAHGITCALEMWAYQIADLASDYRVIAYDLRGHGRSGVPPARGNRGDRGNYSLDHLAGDLDAVLEATLAPGERAVIAGHSMGGMAITAWAERYPDRVHRRADAVALINTSTGDVIQNVRFLPMPPPLAGARLVAAGTLLRMFGATPLVRMAELPSRRFVSTLAVGRDADPAVIDFVYDLFESTPAAGRGGWVRTMVDAMGSQHIDLRHLTVPTLVIGSDRDRILPIGSSRRIADAAPNLTGFVELASGHCTIVERPDEVNKHLRALAESVTEQRRATS